MTVSSAIVTVIDDVGIAIGDFEFPLQVPVIDLIERFSEILKEINNERFSDISNVFFKYKNVVLKDDDTFWKKGIWDGSIIELNYCRR